MRRVWTRSRRDLKILLLVAACCVAFSGLVANSDEVDAQGEIHFVAKNMMATADGTFHRFKITESHVVPDAIEESHVTVEVDVASVDTDNKRRDDHLRTPDFFEVERWPTATVRVASAE